MNHLDVETNMPLLIQTPIPTEPNPKLYLNENRFQNLNNPTLERTVMDLNRSPNDYG